MYLLLDTLDRQRATADEGGERGGEEWVRGGQSAGVATVARRGVVSDEGMIQ